MLRICSWNINGGMHDVAAYLKNNIFPHYDIICLQELHDTTHQVTDRYIAPENSNYKNKRIDTHLYSALVKIAANNFHCYFASQLEGLHDTSPHEGVLYGNAMFVRKILPITMYSSGVVFGAVNQLNTEDVGGLPAGKSGQVVTVQHRGSPLTIGHFHGHWSQNGKVDSYARMEQNTGVERLFAPHVMLHGNRRHLLLLGDFNYTSEMQALRNMLHASMFGHTGARVGGIHLNEVHGITDTRTAQYQKEVREADHAIASKAIADMIMSCTVDIQVPSDHALYVVEIE